MKLSEFSFFLVIKIVKNKLRIITVLGRGNMDMTSGIYVNMGYLLERSRISSLEQRLQSVSSSLLLLKYIEIVPLISRIFSVREKFMIQPIIH